MRIQTTSVQDSAFQKSVAALTAALFIATTLFTCVPQASAQTINTQVQGGNPSDGSDTDNKSVPKPSSPAGGEDLSRLVRVAEIRIPPELGQIDEVYLGPRSTHHAPRNNPINETRKNEEPNRGPWPVARNTIVFIQDAHDSLEAQENIAKIITHLVANYGVRTVFEEGYEGPVPTDEYFGAIKDPKVREKVSYFLMDHLRLGGAEFAHINRFKSEIRNPKPETNPNKQNSIFLNKNISELNHSGFEIVSPPEDGSVQRIAAEDFEFRNSDLEAPDWSLIGADSLKLHKENIDQYRRSATKKDAVTKDLDALEQPLRSLADRRFPKELRDWLKIKEQFDAKKLDLFTYIERTLSLPGPRATSHGPRSERTELWTGLLQFIAEAVKTNDPVVIEKAKKIDAREVFAELVKLEQAVANTFLKDETDRRLFTYYKTLFLIRRLNDLQVTQEEYASLLGHEPRASGHEAVKSRGPWTVDRGPSLAVNTQGLAEFIHKHTGKTLVLSKRWEQNIRDAVRFYEVAHARDAAISETIDNYWGHGPRATNHGPRNKRTETWSVDRVPAILVYGGFHKENIKRILESKGINYLIVSPRITKPSPRHEQFYKQLMTAGRLPYESPLPTRTATRAESRLEVWNQTGPAFARAEVRSFASVFEKNPRDTLAAENELRGLWSTATDPSEARTDQPAAKRAEARMMGSDKKGANGVDETPQAGKRISDQQISDALEIMSLTGGPVKTGVFSPKGTYLFAQRESPGARARLVYLKERRAIDLPEDLDPVSAEFSPDEKFLIVETQKGVRLFYADRGLGINYESYLAPEERGRVYTDLKISADGKTFVFTATQRSGRYGERYVYRFENNRLDRLLFYADQEKHALTGAGFRYQEPLPDQLLLGPEHEEPVFQDYVDNIILSPDGRLAFVISHYGRAGIFDLETNRRVAVDIPRPGTTPADALFSPDGTKVVITYRNGDGRLLSLEGKPEEIPGDFTLDGGRLDWTQDSRWLIRNQTNARAVFRIAENRRETGPRYHSVEMRIPGDPEDKPVAGIQLIPGDTNRILAHYSGLWTATASFTLENDGIVPFDLGAPLKNKTCSISENGKFIFLINRGTSEGALYSLEDGAARELARYSGVYQAAFLERSLLRVTIDAGREDLVEYYYLNPRGGQPVLKLSQAAHRSFWSESPDLEYLLINGWLVRTQDLGPGSLALSFWGNDQKTGWFLTSRFLSRLLADRHIDTGEALERARQFERVFRAILKETPDPPDPSVLEALSESVMLDVFTGSGQDPFLFLDFGLRCLGVDPAPAFQKAGITPSGTLAAEDQIAILFQYLTLGETSRATASKKVIYGMARQLSALIQDPSNKAYFEELFYRFVMEGKWGDKDGPASRIEGLSRKDFALFDDAAEVLEREAPGHLDAFFADTDEAHQRMMRLFTMNTIFRLLSQASDGRKNAFYPPGEAVTPIEYAEANPDMTIKFGEHFEVVVQTGSFRRTVFKKRGGGLLFAIEDKHPGEDSGRKLITMQDYNHAVLAWQFGKERSRHQKPMAFLGYSVPQIAAYGVREKYSTLGIVLFRYDDGVRLEGTHLVPDMTPEDTVLDAGTSEAAGSETKAPLDEEWLAVAMDSLNEAFYERNRKPGSPDYQEWVERVAIDMLAGTLLQLHLNICNGTDNHADNWTLLRDLSGAVFADDFGAAFVKPNWEPARKAGYVAGIVRNLFSVDLLTHILPRLMEEIRIMNMGPSRDPSEPSPAEAFLDDAFNILNALTSEETELSEEAPYKDENSEPKLVPCDMEQITRFKIELWRSYREELKALGREDKLRSIPRRKDGEYMAHLEQDLHAKGVRFEPGEAEKIADLEDLLGQVKDLKDDALETVGLMARETSSAGSYSLKDLAAWILLGRDPFRKESFSPRNWNEEKHSGCLKNMLGPDFELTGADAPDIRYALFGTILGRLDTVRTEAESYSEALRNELIKKVLEMMPEFSTSKTPSPREEALFHVFYHLGFHICRTGNTTGNGHYYFGTTEFLEAVIPWLVHFQERRNIPVIMGQTLPYLREKGHPDPRNLSLLEKIVDGPSPNPEDGRGPAARAEARNPDRRPETAGESYERTAKIVFDWLGEKLSRPGPGASRQEKETALELFNLLNDTTVRDIFLKPVILKKVAGRAEELWLFRYLANIINVSTGSDFAVTAFGKDLAVFMDGQLRGFHAGRLAGHERGRHRFNDNRYLQLLKRPLEKWLPIVKREYAGSGNAAEVPPVFNDSNLAPLPPVVIPTADRPDALARLLKELAGNAERFGHRKVRIVVFDTSKKEQNLLENRKTIAQFGNGPLAVEYQEPEDIKQWMNAFQDRLEASAQDAFRKIFRRGVWAENPSVDTAPLTIGVIRSLIQLWIGPSAYLSMDDDTLPEAAMARPAAYSGRMEASASGASGQNNFIRFEQLEYERSSWIVPVDIFGIVRRNLDAEISRRPLARVSQRDSQLRQTMPERTVMIAQRLSGHASSPSDNLEMVLKGKAPDQRVLLNCAGGFNPFPNFAGGIHAQNGEHLAAPYLDVPAGEDTGYAIVRQAVSPAMMRAFLGGLRHERDYTGRIDPFKSAADVAVSHAFLNLLHHSVFFLKPDPFVSAGVSLESMASALEMDSENESLVSAHINAAFLAMNGVLARVFPDVSRAAVLGGAFATAERMAEIERFRSTVEEVLRKLVEANALLLNYWPDFTSVSSVRLESRNAIQTRNARSEARGQMVTDKPAVEVSTGTTGRQIAGTLAAERGIAVNAALSLTGQGRGVLPAPINKPVVLVMETERIDAMTPEDYRNFLILTAKAYTKLRLVVPDADRQDSPRVKDLRERLEKRFSLGLPRTSAGVPVYGFADDSADALRGRLGRSEHGKVLVKSLGECFLLKNSMDGIVLALLGVPPETLREEDGLLRDERGLYTSQLRAALENLAANYIAVSSAA